MIIELSSNSIAAVSGGTMSYKTSLSTAANICAGAGTALQAFGQTLHVNLPKTKEETDASSSHGSFFSQKTQRILAIGFATLGFALNVTSMALSAISAAEE